MLSIQQADYIADEMTKGNALSATAKRLQSKTALPTHVYFQMQ